MSIQFWGLRWLCIFLVVNFFRFPNRVIIQDDNTILAPADGKIVVIEETEEPEYFKDRRLQVSIFMNIFNVHINWFPVNGVIKYFKYHKGNFAAAYLPKSSTENERTTIVIECNNGKTVLMRQIAGAMAKRIVSYAPVGGQARQDSTPVLQIRFAGRSFFSSGYPNRSEIGTKNDRFSDDNRNL